jgi:D-hexose-6-phosphate mutarotase
MYMHAILVLTALCVRVVSSAVVDLLGACVTSWKTSDGREMLYSSSDGSSRLSGSKQR